MSTWEAVQTAFRSLAGHKLRSFLSMMGMIFGVGAVIAMLAIGAGGEQEALDLIRRLGLSNVLVRAAEIDPEQRAEVREKSLGVSLRDAEAIQEAVNSVEAVAPRVEIDSYQILASGAKTEAKVYGVSHLMDEISDLRVVEGRFVDLWDERDHAQVCVIGPAVRRDLFGHHSPLGANLKVDDVWLEVVGVLADQGGSETSVQGVAVGSTSSEIYLPVTTALRKFERDPLEAPLDELVIHLAEGASPGETARLVQPLLDRLHGGEDDFEIVIPEALMAQSRQTQRLFNIVMGSIAGISLLVGGIGIMNIMLASVLERVREIGVRRAMGARRTDIRNQFVIESFSISLLGGGMGVLLGVLLARGVAAYAGWPTVITAWSLLLSTGVSVLVGLLSGIYPATRAANLHPIEALRYE